MASKGYPESSSKGDVITGVDAAEALDGVHVIHAGTALAGRSARHRRRPGARGRRHRRRRRATARAAAYDGVAADRLRRRASTAPTSR